MKQCKTEVDLKMATYLKNQHKMVFGEARRKIQEIKQSAVQFPSDNLFIQVIKSLKKTGGGKSVYIYQPHTIRKV